MIKSKEIHTLSLDIIMKLHKKFEINLPYHVEKTKRRQNDWDLHVYIDAPPVLKVGDK